MSEQSADTLLQKRAPVFRGSLVRTVVISLVIIALVPATIIGLASYLQFNNLIQSQVFSQLKTLSLSNSLQIDQLVTNNQTAIQRLPVADEVTSAFLESSSVPNIFLTDSRLNLFLSSTINTYSTNGLIGIYALSADGKVIFASDTTKINIVFSSDPVLSALIGTSTSTLAVNPGNFYPNQLILITSLTKQIAGMDTPVTFLYFSSSPLFSELLKNPVSNFTSANVFYITTDKRSLSLNPVSQLPQSKTVSADYFTKLNGFTQNIQSQPNLTYTNDLGQEVYAYIKPIPNLNSYYFIEVPVNSVSGQIQQLLNFLLLALAVTLIASGLIAFLGARQIAVPLVDLSDKARKFASGDFNQKANINRQNEIGLLASSFNFMVDQLSTFYTSLESRIAERTEQLRTTSEIAQDAVSASTTNAILERITRSIVEKLGYPYASVYLADKSNKNLVLTEDHSSLDEKLPERNLRIPIDSTSLMGWAAANRQPRISQNVFAEKPKLLSSPLLPSTQSELSLPITIADRLIGVLDIQSNKENAFDFESMPAFTTLTNQISTGLRNLELLESTQINLQETAALYSATRLITQAQTEVEIFQQISNLFMQTAFASFFFNVNQGDIQLVNLADAQSTPSDKSLLGTVLLFDNALNQLEASGIQIIDNFQLLTDFSSLNAYFGRRGCHSDAIIPVFEGKQLKHLLAIGSREDTPLTPLQMQPYENLSEAIGISLERIHLSGSLHQKQSQIQVLSSLASQEERNIELPRLFENAHNQLRPIFGEEIGFCVALFDGEHNQLSIPYYATDRLIEIPSYPLTSDLLSQVAQKGQAIQLEDASLKGQLMIDSSEFRLNAKSWFGMPLISGGKVMGILALFTTESIKTFDQESQTFLALIASRLALAIANDQQTQVLIQLNNTFEYEEFLLGALLENIPDRVSFKNKNNEFIRISKSLAEFLGKTNVTELIGKADEFNYYADEGKNESIASEEIISSQTPSLNLTEKWLNISGEPEWVVSSKIPLIDPKGTVNGLLSISSNITDLVKIRQLAERRADQLQTASEIARESTTGTMDVNITLSRSVDLIKSRFNFYHASIFLIDPLGKFAVLRESTGEAGMQLKQSHHKLAVGSASIVGQATDKGIPVLVGNVTQEVNYFANPLLPDTRSELAIPMKIGEKILGAVDVQSREINAFSPEDINILQALADQIAVAVQNEDLFTHTNQSLARHRLLHRITSANVESMTVEDSIRASLEILHQALPEEMVTYLEAGKGNVLTARAFSGVKNPDQTVHRIPFGRGAIGLVASKQQPIRIDDAQSDPTSQPLDFETNSILAVPVTFADSLIGVINIESTDLAKFDEDDQEFATTLAGNMGAIISNINLIEQVRDQINRQQKLFEISSKIRRSVDLETIMQTSITEIGNAMNARHATIQLSPKFESGSKKEQE